jgi:hypothetical protein
MTIRTATKALFLLVLSLPLAIVVLAWVHDLLAAMGDASAVLVVGHMNTIIRVVWLIALVGLVVILAVQSLDEKKPPEPE